MSKKKRGKPARKRNVRKAMLTGEELADAAQRMPYRHPEGLEPFAVDWLRNLYKRVGFYRSPTFEQWELGFLRDTNPKSEIMIWEVIARTYETYVENHPDCDHKQVLGSVAAISVGGTPKEETKQWKDLRRIWRDVRGLADEDPLVILSEMLECLGYDVDEAGEIVKRDDFGGEGEDDD